MSALISECTVRPNFKSASKGESVSDTIRVISCYADICAMRHPKEGAPLVASEKSRIPVINAASKLSLVLVLGS